VKGQKISKPGHLQDRVKYRTCPWNKEYLQGPSDMENKELMVTLIKINYE